MTDDVTLADLSRCFEGAVPAVIATAAADGAPNVTYLSKVRMVDDERIAVSNQFFSKTARNLAENPRASILLVDPVHYDQYRLAIVYERTERRGPVFEQLRADVDALAALQEMQQVFKLRAADIYRVIEIEVDPTSVGAEAGVEDRPSARDVSPTQLATLTARLTRCADLDTLVGATVDGLAELLGFEHSLLLLADESGTRLFTIASHGYEVEGVGSEVAVGEGVIGMAAARCAPMRIGNVRQMTKYSRTVRRSFEAEGGIGPGRELPVPGLADAASRLAVPAVAMGQLVGVLVVESTEPVAFDAGDEAALALIASVLAGAVEAERSRAAHDEPTPSGGVREATAAGGDAASGAATATHVRFFSVDGSTFLDGDYLIKGVAGRLLWSLLQHHERDGRTEFTNREVRLDPTLELPEFRDNFESRLVLLKRRLEEHEAPMRIEKSGRGRFRLVVERPLRLDLA